MLDFFTWSQVNRQRASVHPPCAPEADPGTSHPSSLALWFPVEFRQGKVPVGQRKSKMGTLTLPRPVCGGAEDWLYPQTKGLRGVLSTQPSASWFWKPLRSSPLSLPRNGARPGFCTLFRGFPRACPHLCQQLLYGTLFRFLSMPSVFRWGLD